MASEVPTCRATMLRQRPAVANIGRSFPGFSKRQFSPKTFHGQAGWSRRSVTVRHTLTVNPTETAEQTRQEDTFTGDDYNKFISGYRSQYLEHDYWIDDSMVEGEIPKELEGTLLRNGPGLFEVGGKSLPQPLDGDGMVTYFAFKDGRCFFRNRYVRTEAFVREQAAQRLLYRGAFSVGNPSGGFFFNPFDFSVKGIANTGVLHWGGKLLALYERDLPYALDNSLRTLGQTDLEGTVDTPKAFFGAHYRVERGSGSPGRLVAFNFSEEPTSALLHFFEYDEDFKLLHKSRWDLPGAQFGFFHDFLVTENYYVLLENPIRMNFGKLLTKYMLGQACLAECLEFVSSKPTTVHLLPRPNKAAAGLQKEQFETFPFFSFHHVNAFEVEDKGLVVVDTCAAKGIDFSKSLDNGGAEVFSSPSNGRTSLTRLIIDRNSGKVKSETVDPDYHSELPTVNWAKHGRPYLHMYHNSSRVRGPPAWGPMQDVVKTSLPPSLGVEKPFSLAEVKRDCWSPGRDSFAQEPIFVARPGAEEEDDGWVLSVVYEASSRTSHLAILDAKNLSAGPVARIRLPHHVPLGIHGSFTPDYLGPDQVEAAPKQVYNILNGVEEDGKLKYA
eukprot:jgi/Botrbrau1/16172/Bobra.0272s0007.1